MLRPDVEALLQGAVDETLTPEERHTLRRLMADSVEVEGRAADLEQLTELLASLPPAEAPPRLVHDVLAQISKPPVRQHPARPFVPVSAPKRGVPLKKSILFGLAAAAAVVLAVTTYYSNPPATVGTEATIGAAQRAQAPQIAAKDVALGDTSAQEVLQTETWDQIMKDPELRSLLQDAELRTRLMDAELRNSLSNDAVRRALQDPDLAKKLDDPNLKRSLNDAQVRAKLDDANLEAALKNRGFVEALRNDSFRAQLRRPGVAAALSRHAFQNALKDRNFEAALRNGAQFEASLKRGIQAH
jgi:hypothetical protein